MTESTKPGRPAQQTAESEVRRRTIVGMRWVVFLNLATTPLSFLTNVILARSSPLALGYYGAFQIVVGTCQTLLFFGGRQVFVRFIPALDDEERVSFTITYVTMVWAGIVALFFVGATVLSDQTQHLFERLGHPPTLAVLALALVIATRVATVRFQFGILSGARAAITQKVIVIGYLVIAVLGYFPLRAYLTDDPSGYVWTAGSIVHVIACLVGLASVTQLSWSPRRIRLFLPPGFWSTAFYSYMVTLVAFVYRNLSPVLVLLWIDVTALASLHAAMRFDLLLKMIPVLSADVLAPALAKLDASGRRDKAIRQAATAIRAMLILLVPVVLGLILFGRDAMAVFGPSFEGRADLVQIVVVGSLAGPMIQIGWGMVAAFGEFRAYLFASVLYVLSAVAITAGLVSGMGVVGGALAATLGAFVHQSVLAWVLRSRLGFRMPSIAYAGWGCAAAASVVAIWMDPPRWIAAAIGAALWVGFLVVGRVQMKEVRELADRLLRRTE